MKNFFSLIMFLCICIVGYAQENSSLPVITPPAPNAAAFHVYGNTEVNHYTGSPNVSVPLYEINEGGINIPIYLKYTGGNGIKVSEVASWVGLGWTLNTGGAISRVKRGLYDEDNYGVLFTNGPTLPQVDTDGEYINADDMVNMVKGYRDSAHDIFHFNYPGGSGQFFIKPDGSIFMKPMNELKVSFGGPYLSGIPSFTIEDTNGLLFYFEAVEKTFSFIEGAPLTDNRYFPSTWYLSRIVDQKSNRFVQFYYEDYYYEDTLINGNIKSDVVNKLTDYEEVSYFTSQHKAKRISKIEWTSGAIEFKVPDNLTRKDLKLDKFLESLIIKDKNDNTIKSYEFAYEYMTLNGIKNISEVVDFSNSNRLMLKQITEKGSNGLSKPPYKFDYNVDNNLPERDSKSTDHWGFFNGQNNLKYLPKHFLSRFDRDSWSWETKQHGSADKEVYQEYEQTAILKNITYPTGGETEFEYETHLAKNAKLRGQVVEQIQSLGFPGEKQIIDVSLSTEAMPLTKLEIEDFFSNAPGVNCFSIYYVKDVSNNQVDTYSMEDGNNHDIYLTTGQYEVWYTLDSNVVNDCPNEDPAPNRLKWLNETSSENKLVGGVRIKSVKDKVDGIVRNKTLYNYDDAGITSGSIVNIPIYSYNISGYYEKEQLPNGYRRYALEPTSFFIHSVQSRYPLMTTQGSHVGYGKVTVSKEGFEIGKTVYEYTTANEYPDSHNSKAWQPGSNSWQHYPGYFLFLGKNVWRHPFVSVDSKDYLRGLLLKKTLFKKVDSEFLKVSEYENEYEKLVTYPAAPGNSDGFVDNEENYINGASIERISIEVLDPPYPGHSPSTSTQIRYEFTYYDIFSGYAMPKSNVERIYDNLGNFVETKSTQKYQTDLNFLNLEKFRPYQTTSIDSYGNLFKTDFKYADDLNVHSLLDQNRIATPIETSVTKVLTDGSEEALSRQKTDYKDWGNGIVLPEKLLVAKGGDTLEDRLIYHSYDDNGNPLEVSIEGGARISYVWGYNATHPIVKLEHVSYATMTTVQHAAIESVKAASNLDNDVATENALRLAQKNLRAVFPEAMVSTYTYDPLIGVTSMTDPRGYTMYYEYDEFNRLKQVRDAKNNLLSKNEYNYALQPQN